MFFQKQNIKGEKFINENIQKHSFNVGERPDFAENPKDADVLEGQFEVNSFFFEICICSELDGIGQQINTEFSMQLRFFYIILMA